MNAPINSRTICYRWGWERKRVVGLLLQRSLELVIAMLGVLKAGMTYLPLDAAYPAERLRFMVEDGGWRCCSVRSSCWSRWRR